MTSETDDLRLAADFAPATYDDWRKLVDGVLKGAPFEKLVGKTYDGLKIEPIYRRAHDAAPIAGRAAAAPWQIMQRIDHPDAGDRQRAGAARSRKRRHRADAGVCRRQWRAMALDWSRRPKRSSRFSTASSSMPGLRSNFRSVRNRGWPRFTSPNTSSARASTPRPAISASASIRSAPARSGDRAPIAWAEIVPAVTGAIKGLAALGFKGPFALADGRVIHDAGGSEVQELAFVLATGVAYLRALEGAGVALEAARGMVYARLSADADQFLTMAKFRALRLLWARVEQACGLAPKPFFIAADTAWRMLTQRDPYVNMLRATMATFSAGLGGANAITVLPHTLALGLPDRVRAARGAQHATGAAGRIQSRQGIRSGGRLRRHRNPDAAALRSRMVAVSGDRESRRRVRRARAKPDPAQGRGNARGARSQYRPAQGSADRRQRVSQPA